MVLDTDLALLTLALGTLAYGIYTKTTKNTAGYNQTPPPQQPKHTKIAQLPGVPESFFVACQKAVDAPGATLSGPTAPKGMEPDRVHELVRAVVKRIDARDVMCTAIDGGTCVADAEGSEQYDIVCVMYDKHTNVTVQMHVGILALDDGRLMVTKLAPASQVESDALAREDPWTLDHSPYSFPIDGV